MHSTQDEAPRRRHWVPLLAAVATFMAVAGLAVAARFGGGDAPPPASPMAAPPSPSAAPGPTPTATVTPGPPANGLLGGVIATGLRAGDAEVAFAFRSVNISQLPEVTFGVTAGVRDASGQFAPRVGTNETVGPSDGPGFHAWQAPTSGMPEFGYYAGPAAKIVRTTPDGTTLVAGQAVWDLHPEIVVFWFDPATLPAGAPTLRAYDAAGAPLPTGRAPGPAVG